MLALALGPRQGERLGLGWDMVDLQAEKISWSRSIYRRRWEHGCSSPQNCPAKNGKGHLCPQRTGGGLYFGTVKSSAGERVNAIPQQLQGPLEVLWQQHVDAGRPAYTDPAGVSVELVFQQPNGGPWQREQDQDRWHSFLAGAGVPPRRVHDQRHTTATVLLLMGVEPRTVMDLMGWSQLSMLTRYQHVLDEVRRDAGARVGDALWQAPASPQPPHQPTAQQPKEQQPAPVTSLDEWRARRAG